MSDLKMPKYTDRLCTWCVPQPGRDRRVPTLMNCCVPCHRGSCAYYWWTLGADPARVMLPRAAS
jgi:hypothetical protein